MFSHIVPLTRIHSDYGSISTSDEFTKNTLSHQRRLNLASSKHLEMNSVLERTWQSLCHLKNSFIVHAWVDESCTHFALLHTICIFSVIPICALRRNDSFITPYELLCARKPKLHNFQVLFCPYIVKKYSATKTTSSTSLVSIDVAKMSTQHGVCRIYIGVDNITNDYLIFLPQTLQIVSSLDVIFDEHYLSALIYKNCSYCKAILTRPIFESFPYSDIWERTG